MKKQKKRNKAAKHAVALAKKAKKAAKNEAKKTESKRESKEQKPKKDKTQKRNVRVKSVEDRLCWKLVGVALLAAAVFSAVALASFDPPPDVQRAGWTCSNLIGVFGNSFAQLGYAVFGLAIWCLPLAFIIGALKLFEAIPKDVEEISNGKVVLRIFGLVLMAVVVSGLFQLSGKWSWVQALLTALHIGRDAGGCVGRLFMTEWLEKCIAAFGATFLSLGLLFLSLCMALGLKTVRKLFDWHLPELDGVFSETAEAVDEMAEKGIKIIKGAADRAPFEEVLRPVPPVLRPERKPAPKIKYPSNAELPPLRLLDPIPPQTATDSHAEEMGAELMKKLKEFGVYATLSYAVEGPTVTQFAIKPGHGVRVEKITGLSRDLQLALKAKSLRVFAPIPGEEAVGVQVSNANPQPVLFREIIESENWTKNATWPRNGQPKYPVPLLLGADVAGKPVVTDLTKMPHLLVAGASGKGKSVCLNSIINGLLMTRTPEQLRFILVDPKRMEFSGYEKLPHLLVPVVVDVKKVVGALRWAAKEMERRLTLFAEARARNIVEYNTDAKDHVPYIVIVIDEVADIMTQCGRDVEPVLNRLMALARATGIHLILATQRPDVKTISGTIKANIPGRIALGTTNVADSRTILDEGGAELLIGKGDMLYKADDGLVRTQGAWISKGEMDRIMEFIVKQWPVQIDESIVEEMESEGEDGGQGDGGAAEEGVTEEEYEDAKRIVIEANRASASMLQQRMKIGYNHASRIMYLLEKRGVIGAARGAGPREILSA